MSLLDDYKLAELMTPSGSPLPPRGTLGAAATSPVFQDMNGTVVTSIACGQAYTFLVPGYNQVWLTMMKNGQKVFDGLFSVPMPSYVSSCASDPGTYQAIAYDPTTGIVLGTTNFTVLPSTGAGQTISAAFANISPTMLAVGAGVLLLILKKKGRK
jgi:hypothetical protein